MKTRNVETFHARDYLKRSEECKNAMTHAFDSQDWNACVITAVHCAISAADAFCVLKKGRRSAEDHHAAAVSLFQEADLENSEVKANAKRLSALLNIKTDAEYGERLLTQKDAKQAQEHAIRLFNFVKSEIEKPG